MKLSAAEQLLVNLVKAINRAKKNGLDEVELVQLSEESDDAARAELEQAIQAQENKE